MVRGKVEEKKKLCLETNLLKQRKVVLLFLCFFYVLVNLLGHGQERMNIDEIK
jgi:hypothetical protein